MSAIEISLFIDKPNARVLTAVILAAGLILHGLAAERAEKKLVAAAKVNGVEKKTELVTAPLLTAASNMSSGPPMLCAVRGIGRTLDFALEEAKTTDRPLYLLFVREQPVLLQEDRRRKWTEDEEARAIFAYANDRSDAAKILPCYAVSDSAPDTIVDIPATIGASYLIVGAPQRSAIVNLLRGNIIRNISDLLPEEIHFLVYA